MIRLPGKVALVSRWVPPMVYGSAGRAYRLFRHIAPEDYCIITCRDMENGEGNVAGVRLPCEYRVLPSEWRRIPTPGSKGIQPLVAWLNVWLKVLQRARNVTRWLRQDKCDIVLSFTGDLIDLPAAYLASRIARRRFFPIVDDDYLSQWTSSHENRFVRQVAPFVFGRAEGLFVISEFMGEVYEKRFRKPCTVLHTATLDRVGEPPAHVPMATGRKLRVVFAGSAYLANANALALTVRALESLADPGARLQVYGWQTHAQLQGMGIMGPVDLHQGVGPEEICKVQEEADILLVVWGFGIAFQEICRTSFPSKVADYLVSGRPILVVTPPASYLAHYFRTHQCGHVVERGDPSLIAEGLRRLASDQEYRTRLVRNAFDAARRDCSYERVVQTFIDTISRSPGRAGRRP